MAAKKPRTAAQRRATAKMIAANRKRSTTTRRRRRPLPAGAKRSVGYTVGSAPVRRRRMNPIRRRRSNPVLGARRRAPVRRANPIRKGFMQKTIDKAVMPAFTAAGGALLLDAAWAYLPIPANLKTGPLKHVIKAVGAIALGELAAMAVSRRTADNMTVGALTVVMHGAGREMLAKYTPTVKMDGMGYMSPAMVAGNSVGMGYYTSQGQGLPRAQGEAPQLGYYPPQAGGGSFATTENESTYRY